MSSSVLRAIDDSDAPFIVGSDEVGYGAWAGPLAVCAVVVPRDWAPPEGLTDSKAMTVPAMRRVRDVFFGQVESGANVWWTLQWADVEEIDANGVGNTLLSLHVRAIGAAIQRATTLSNGRPPLVIADGNVAVQGALSLPKADSLIPAVSMASVIAKIARDEVMATMANRFQGYGFESHVGYGTKAHREALDSLGPCALHRKSYSPVAERIRAAEQPQEAWLGLPEE